MSKQDFGLRISDCGLGERRLSRVHDSLAQSAISNPQSAIPAARGAFTLIELLITITIISILSAAILGTAASALEAGRRSKTQSMITKINGLLLERWDSYADRRLDVNRNVTTNTNVSDSIESKYRSQQIDAVQRGQMLADARMIALRELMKMELPDSWGDFADPPLMLNGVPALVQVYRQRSSEVQSHPDAAKYQAAECLYLIIMYGTGDGEARTLFSSNDIGDADGDGAPEFHDGWGNPIKFIRWPAGFVSQSAVMTGDGDADHDPFDLYNRDSPTAPRLAATSYPGLMQGPVKDLENRYQLATNVGVERVDAFRLVPLVYSAGPDGEIDEPGYTFAHSSSGSNLDPFAFTLDGDQIGTPKSLSDNYEQDQNREAWKDNLTNHLNEY